MEEKIMKKNTNQPHFTVAPFVTDLEGIPTCYEDDQISAVFDTLLSSHAAVFVYTSDEQFVGIVSPQQTLYEHRYPQQTLVKNAMIKPMHVELDSPLFAVAEFMAGARVYTLPVFKKEKLVGAITADSLLEQLPEHEDLFTLTKAEIKLRTPITTSMHEKVKTIHSIFKRKNVSRVVVTDEQGAVVGIVTQRDILPVYIHPRRERTKTSTKVRHGLREREQTFDEEKKVTGDDPVMTYMTENVITAPVGTAAAELLNTMQEQEVHSIILVDADNKPQHFVSRYDFLKALSQIEPELGAPISFYTPSKVGITNFQENLALMQLRLFIAKFNKQLAIRRAVIHFDVIRNAARMTKLFESKLQVHTDSGKKFFASAKEWEMDEAVRQTINKVARQFKSFESRLNDNNNDTQALSSMPAVAP